MQRGYAYSGGPMNYQSQPNYYQQPQSLPRQPVMYGQGQYGESTIYHQAPHAPGVDRYAQEDKYRYQDPPGTKKSVQGGGQKGTPLENKIFVLYIKPGDPVCNYLYSLIQNYEEILVQDATRIVQRPAWLNGVPTIVRVFDNAVFEGNEAVQAIHTYVQIQRMQGGAQDQMVKPVVGNNAGFEIEKDKTLHSMSDKETTTPVPLGQGSAVTVGAGSIQLHQDSGLDDIRYNANGKVTDDLVARYGALRNMQRPPPQNVQQWRSEVTGDLVNM